MNQMIHHNLEIDILRFCFSILVVFHHWSFHGFTAGILRFVVVLKKFGFNFYGRIFLSILEVCCYLISVIYMWKFHPSYWDFYIVLLLFIGISISLSELSLFSFINRFNIQFFRKASICILFSHFYVAQYFQTNYPQFTDRTGKLLVIAQVIALSVLNYLLAKLIKTIACKFVSLIKLKEESKIA